MILFQDCLWHVCVQSKMAIYKIWVYWTSKSHGSGERYTLLRASCFPTISLQKRKSLWNILFNYLPLLNISYGLQCASKIIFFFFKTIVLNLFHFIVIHGSNMRIKCTYITICIYHCFAELSCATEKKRRKKCHQTLRQLLS